MNDMVFGKDKVGKVYTFWSPQVGAGASFLALQTAKKIAENGTKTLLIDWDLRTPTLTKNLNMRDTMHYLDNLLPNAASRNVSRDLLLSYTLERSKNLYFLSGVQNPELALDIDADSIEYLLDSLKKEFDCIIIDTNSYIDNAGTFVGLVKSDKVLMVVEKKYQMLRTFDYAKSFLDNGRVVDFSKFEIVVNKVEKSILLSSKEIETFFKKEQSIEIVSLGVDYFNDDNIGKGEEFLKSSKKAQLFHKSIEDMILLYFVSDKLEENENEKPKKKGFFGGIGRG